MPVYQLTQEHTDAPACRIIEAKTQSGAVNHATKDLYSVVSLTASDLLKHLDGGAIVEKAVENASEDIAQTRP